MSTQPYMFIWVPKSAGSSIVAALHKADGMLDLKYRRQLDNFDWKGGLTLRHRGLDVMIRKGHVSQDFVDHAFKFTFVRNPWDRFVSLYHYWQETIPDQMAGVGFKDTCVAVSKMALGRPRGKNIAGYQQALPQTAWICDHRGVIQADFVGRFENVAEDFQKICKHLGIEATLRKLNKSRFRRKDYRTYYDAESRAIIARMYRNDIRIFKYSFEGPDDVKDIGKSG